MRMREVRWTGLEKVAAVDRCRELLMASGMRVFRQKTMNQWNIRYRYFIAAQDPAEGGILIHDVTKEVAIIYGVPATMTAGEGSVHIAEKFAPMRDLFVLSQECFPEDTEGCDVTDG